MSDYDDYEEDGYDYGDGSERDEEDYPDEPDDDYEYAEENPIVDFAYRDIGSEGRIGAPVDEDLGLPMGTTIAGGGMVRRHEMMYMDPMVQFSMDVARILNTEQSLNFTDSDKSTIKRAIKKVPLVRYKNPMMFVLGYYIQLDMREDNRASAYLSAKLKRIPRITGNDDRISLFEVLKYARYWKLVLLK